MQETPKKKKNQLSSYVRYSSLAIQMAIIISAGSFLGEFIDSKTKYAFPIFTIIFSLLSVGGSLYYVFQNITNEKTNK